MVPLGEDEEKDGLVYFELSEAQARRILGRSI